MKFVVKQGTKRSPSLTARQILRHFRKGTFSSDAVVEDSAGRQRPLREFAAQLEESGQTSGRESPQFGASTGEVKDEGIDAEIADFLTAGLPEVEAVAEPVDDSSSPEGLTSRRDQFVSTFREPPDPPEVVETPLKHPAPECAFPGSLICLLTDAVESHVRPLPKLRFAKGQAEGIMLTIGFLLLTGTVIYSAAQSEVDTVLRVVISLFGLGFLFVVLASFHFLNVRLIQFQRQMFRPVYVCADRLIIQAVVVVASFAITGVLFLMGWTALSSFFSNERIWDLIVILTNGVLSIVVLRSLLHSGTHLEAIGIKEDPEATATQTYLASLMAILRAPLLISSTLHFVGAMGVMVIGVCLVLAVFEVWVNGIFLATILFPLVASCLLYPLLNTLGALFGGISIEFVNAVLSIERTLREQRHEHESVN